MRNPILWAVAGAVAVVFVLNQLQHGGGAVGPDTSRDTEKFLLRPVSNARNVWLVIARTMAFGPHSEFIVLHFHEDPNTGVRSLQYANPSAPPNVVAEARRTYGV